MDLMERDLIFLEKIEKTPGFVEARDSDTIRKLLASTTPRKDDDLISIEVLHALLSRYQHLIYAPDKEIRDHFEHLIRRVQEAIQSRFDSPA
jgi:hypothetical protein